MILFLNLSNICVKLIDDLKETIFKIELIISLKLKKKKK
jgi:hypothetical protein